MFSTRSGPGVRDEFYVIGRRAEAEAGTGNGSGGFLAQVIVTKVG